MGFLMRFRRTVLSVSITAAIATLSACGGGGGGGGSQTYINNQVPIQPSGSVPFHTPTRIATVDPLTNDRNYALMEMFTANISGNSYEEVVIAGRAPANIPAESWPSSKISVFGWDNGTFKDLTSQWFSGTDNVIVGTEPSVKFGDFNGSGRQSMWVAPGTDGVINTQPGYIFVNNGTNFTRHEINMGTISSHDSVVYDINRDGLADIVTLDFGTNTNFIFGNRSGTFTPYSVNSWAMSGSGIAAGDFLNNGTTTFIVTDTGSSRYSTRLISWAFDGTNVTVADIGTLPLPRFELPKYDGVFVTPIGQNRSHNIRALAFDYDTDGVQDAVIISRPSGYSINGVAINSEVQFLKNNGSGTFTDTTDSVLVGYDVSKVASYNPKLMDFNNDGLIDIFLPAAGVDQTQVLIHTREHKFVASYVNIITDFANQTANMETFMLDANRDGIVNVVRGPNGDLYLLNLLSIEHTTGPQKALYLSKLGGTTTLNAQASVDLIKQLWPYMSDASANQVLASTGTTYFGATIINLDQALQPIGSVGIPASGRLLNLGGYIGGINLNGSANQISVLDSMGRDFTINYSSTNVPNVMNMWGRFVENIDDDTRGAQVSGVSTVRHNGFKFGGTEDNRNMVIGFTGIELTKDTSLSVQYTRMPFSPFVRLNGSWGLVKSSSTMESTVTNRQGGFVNKLGLMYSSTEIEQGLVNRINPISSVWAETGYEWKHFKAYAGILPKVISGSADITLPTGVDNAGRISYTNTKADVYSPTVAYARFSYSDRINKKVSYRVNGIVTSQQQHSIIGDVQISF